MTLLEAILYGVSNYPIPEQAVETAALVRGVVLTEEASAETLQSKEYRLLEADVKMWVARTANISQGGVSIDTLVSTKELYKTQANAVYKEYGDKAYDASGDKATFGYKGSRL